MYKYLANIALVSAALDSAEPEMATNLEFKDNTLRTAAEGTGILVGTAMNYWHLGDKNYADTAAREYNIITAEASCKMDQIAKGENNFNFKGCDGIKDYAKKHGMHMRGHNLIWGKKGDWFPGFIWHMNA